MTWDELLEYMDASAEWGAEDIKHWHELPSALVHTSACDKADSIVRAIMQNQLASICEDMCEELGTYPTCTYPGFIPPDVAPGVVDWIAPACSCAEQVGGYL